MKHVWYRFQSFGVYRFGGDVMVDPPTSTLVLDLYFWRWNLRIGVDR